MDVITAVRGIAGDIGVPPGEVALAWLLSKPVVVAPIVGATSLSHLESAVRALDLTLTGEQIAAVESPYRPHGVKGI